MSTTIDRLQIEIESSSGNAAKGIDDLAKSLAALKKSGTISVAVKNLNNLSDALNKLPNVHPASNALRTLANSIEKLKGVGTISGTVTSLGKLPGALKSLGNINLDKVAPKIKEVADAMAPLSAVKAGGFGTLVSGLSRLDKVTKSLSEETITAFTEKVERLTQKLGPLSEKMTSIKGGFAAINSASRSAGGGVSKLDEEVNTTTLNLANMITVIQGVVAAVQPLITLLANSIGTAMEWDGIRYQFGNAFGEQADEYYEKITKITDALYINKQAFMENSAMATSMLAGFGVDKTDAREMGVGYTELAYDIWAAYNNVYKSLDGADGAMAAVRSAIAGEVEPIRRAGFTIVDSQLAITAANHGLAYSTTEATEAQKSYLRYLTLVDQAQKKGVVGTYAREMQTAEGMIRQFRQQLNSLSQAFGSLFLPMLVKVMPYVQAFVELLTEGVHWLAALFGVEIQDIGDTWNDYSSGVKDAVSNTDGVTDSIKDATAAAKELKNASIGIDELNVISPPSASSGAGGSGAGGAGGAGSGYSGIDVSSLWDESIFDGIQNQVDSLKSKLKGVFDDWLPTLKVIGAALGAWTISGLLDQFGNAIKQGDKFEGIVKNIRKIASTAISIVIQFKLMKDAFGDFMGEDGSIKDYIEAVVVGAASTWFLWKQWGAGGLAIGLGVTAVASFSAVIEEGGIDSAESLAVAVTGVATSFGALAAGWKAAKPVVEKIKEFLSTAKVHAAEFGWFAALFPKLSEGIASIGPALTTALGNIKTFFGGLGTFFTSIMTAILAHPWITLGVAVVTAIVGAIVLAIVDHDFTDIGYKLGQMLGKTIKGVLDFGSMIWERIQSGIAWVVDAIENFTWEGFWKAFIDIGSNIVSGIWSGIQKGWKNLKENISEFVDGFVQGFKDALGIHSPSTVFAKIGQYCVDGLKSTLGINTIKDKLLSMWNTAKSWWDGKKSALKTYTPSIGSIYDKLKSRWDSARTWWNEKKSKMKEYTPSIGSIYQKVYDRWKNARDWWNGKKGSFKTYTPSIGSITDKIKSAWNSAKSWWSKNAKLSTKLDVKTPKIEVKWDTAKAFGKSFKYPTGFKLKFAANGGIFDQGSLIWAGERGPEVMATAAGGKTGVMNVQQMQDAVYEGVYAAMSAVMRGSEVDGGQSINIYLDGRQITAAVEKRQRERGASIMGNEVYSY